MKLQKRLSRKFKGKEYVKWILTIPPQDIEKTGWKEGQKLKSEVYDSNLIIKKSLELTYDDFKNRILELLNSKPEGFIWQEIKEKLNLEQKVPNNKWVRKLEKEISLRRRNYEGSIYWYLDKKGIIIYTIGYEGKKLDEFINILKNHNIKGLIDVRELANSRKNGFSKSTLSNALRENGIVYRHYPELGSPKALRYKLWDDRNYEEFFKKYSEWLSSSESKTYLEDLEGLAHIRTTAIMCLEKDVNKCHRSIIKKRLIQDGFKVVDL